MAIRIQLADDHQMVRKGIKTLLEDEPGFQVAGEAENGREAIRLAKTLVPDVIVMDLAMPELNGIEAIRAILEVNDKISIVVGPAGAPLPLPLAPCSGSWMSWRMLPLESSIMRYSCGSPGARFSGSPKANAATSIPAYLRKSFRLQFSGSLYFW